MKYCKSFRSYEEQADLLKSRGLRFSRSAGSLHGLSGELAGARFVELRNPHSEPDELAGALCFEFRTAVYKLTVN